MSINAEVAYFPSVQALSRRSNAGSELLEHHIVNTRLTTTGINLVGQPYPQALL
jgi:hypothetical protein